MIFQPPFPDIIIEPTQSEGVAIFVHFAILFFLIILIIYCYKKLESIFPMITVYMFSLIIALQSFTHYHPPFSPMFEIFFLIFQSSIFFMSSMDFYEGQKKKRGIL